VEEMFVSEFDGLVSWPAPASESTELFIWVDREIDDAKMKIV